LNESSVIPKPVTLSIIIPALNEQDSITSIIDRVLSTRTALNTIGVDKLELIVVDDGSTDHTAELVRSYSAVRLVQHAHNQGYGAALKSGFRCASGKLLGFLDADGTYPPENLPQLCQAILNGADIVVGSRRSGAASEMPPVRKLGNFIWSNLLTMIVGQRVVDPASGMRVFRREMLEYIYPLPDGLNFTPVMSTRTAHEHLRLVELPIPYKERQGRSKLSVVRDGIRFMQTILWTALYYNPVRILGGFGAFIIGISLLIALVLIGLRISGVTVLGPWGVAGTFSAVVLSIAGVNLFALGITFNYLVSLFHKRPIHQGMFRRRLFKTPLDRHFWWIGFLLIAGGFMLGIVSFALALNAWPIERLWLYLLAGTMLILVGFQLFIFWVVVRVLDELSRREFMVQNDLNGGQINE
jgi:glycosyltransferase involved in cell wall biosynthesis